jgi:hypothetical protein
MSTAAERERIAVLEEKVKQMGETLDRVDTNVTMLVSIKDQGRGVLWLAGLLWVSGILSGIAALWHWWVTR